ncbi:hypothetical protein CLD22_21785 [Rubrivivax gelatinosus]|nr:hypothetical protein [Rubrivivax gelatinosus]
MTAVRLGTLKPWQAYAVAFVSTALVLWARLALDEVLGGEPTLIVFAMPIMLSAYLGGLKAGLLATALSFAATTYFLLPPLHSFVVASAIERWQLFFVLLTGVLISVLSAALHRARRRTEALVQELAQHRGHLERLVVARTAELEESRDAAEAANRAKSLFLANMSHEIRTPMNAIIGLTHLVSRDLADPVQRARLHKVDGAAQHLLKIISDILDLSKIDAGKLVLEEAGFARDEFLAGVLAMVQEQARAKGLELVLDSGALPERLHGDAKRLAQALLNLLANAVKFTERGWVRLRCERIAERGEQLQLRFEVRDTGPGIALEDQPRLFNAFEQADNSATRRHGGTGLGLALTRRLAALMGGEAGMESVPGVGSSFWFTVWLGRGCGAAEPVEVPTTTGLHALLVDDLPEALGAIADLLAMLGLEVQACPAPDDALQRLREDLAAGQRPDVMLIDWRMTPMDGMATLQAIGELLAPPLPPSILVTADDDPHLARLAHEAGFDAVLVKPITASSLNDTLMRVLRRRTPVPLRLPPAEAGGRAEAELRRRHQGQRVLLAEDNPVNQEVTAALLDVVGLRVDTADDGLQAVDLASTRVHALVLMDMQMPHLDGIEATLEIRRRLGDTLPILAMTANAFGTDRAACLAAGMNDHIPKPVDPQLLYETLLRWLPERGTGSAPG